MDDDDARIAAPRTGRGTEEAVELETREGQLDGADLDEVLDGREDPGGAPHLPATETDKGGRGARHPLGHEEKLALVFREALDAQAPVKGHVKDHGLFFFVSPRLFL